MQMRCMNLLLKAGAAMTEKQLNIVVKALPTLDEPKVCILALSVPACQPWLSWMLLACRAEHQIHVVQMTPPLEQLCMLLCALQSFTR